MSDEPISPSTLMEALQLGAGDTFAPDVGQHVGADGVVSYFLGIGDLRLAVGGASVTIPFGTDFGQSAPIDHGLSVPPQAIVCTNFGPAFGTFKGAVISAVNADADTFVAQAFAPGYTGGVVTSFYWIAIG